ncbi:hypothetical protein N7535_007852 [Penicillium sp. DV-2018c]|nr:hypothetical protein N7461_003887 [Penicillium sp. DV-2018c]KAJ5566214.1 hypothetical protein N7535_007852 [Penicillium sp. DV-2018c]
MSTPNLLFPIPNKDGKAPGDDLDATALRTRTPYSIDPDGDIILYTPDDPLIVPNKGDVLGNYGRFLVSSRHLALASPYFKAMLRTCWAEGSQLSENGSAEIPVKECKPDILLILLNAIHGRHRQVPRTVSLQQLAALAASTDFFQCHEAIEIFAGQWKAALQPLQLGSFCITSDTINWIMIASVFGFRDTLEEATKVAMQRGTGPFTTNNLPIPKATKDAIDRARQTYMDGLREKIEQRLSQLLTSSLVHCSPKCDAQCLGYVLRKLAKNRITFSISQAPAPSVFGGQTMGAPFFTISSVGINPTTFCSMVLEKPSSTDFSKCGDGYHRPCHNAPSPFGEVARSYAARLDELLPGVKEISTPNDNSHSLVQSVQSKLTF